MCASLVPTEWLLPPDGQALAGTPGGRLHASGQQPAVPSC